MTVTLEHQVPEAMSLDLPFAPESAGIARARLREWLDAHRVTSDACHDARLLLSELVGNAVRHAKPLADHVLRVEWRFDPGAHEGATLEIAVSDGGGTTEPARHEAADGDVSGRGLAIVAHLARRWWVEGDRGVVTVRAVLPL